MSDLLGRYVHRTWVPNPDLYAPARYRRRCEYAAFVPRALAPIDLIVPADLAGIVSDAEATIAALNAGASPALQPLARFLLRTEAIASSRVEGMSMNARDLARAEARHHLGATV